MSDEEADSPVEGESLEVINETIINNKICCIMIIKLLVIFSLL